MAGVSAVASSGKYAPFWLVSNTNGDVSVSPYSGNLTAGIYKEAVHNERWWDYDFAVQLTGRAEYPKTGTGYSNLTCALVPFRYHRRYQAYDLRDTGYSAEYGQYGLLG